MNPESTPKPSPASSTLTPAIGRMTATFLCGLGMIAAFFLPWLGSLRGGLSGYHLQHAPGFWKLFWALPIAGGLTALLTAQPAARRVFSALTGLLPFVLLAYGLTRQGTNLLSALTYGAWTELALGAVLLVLAVKK